MFIFSISIYFLIEVEVDFWFSNKKKKTINNHIPPSPWTLLSLFHLFHLPNLISHSFAVQTQGSEHLAPPSGQKKKSVDSIIQANKKL